MKGVLILSLEEHRHNGETADAGGEEAEEDVGGGDQPEGKDVDHGVAVQGAVGRLGIRPVDPVDPDTASYEPATEKEGDQALHGVGRLWILLVASLSSSHSTQHPN